MAVVFKVNAVPIGNKRMTIYKSIGTTGETTDVGLRNIHSVSIMVQAGTADNVVAVVDASGTGVTTSGMNAGSLYMIKVIGE